MAVAEAPDHGWKAALLRWRWLLLFMVASLVLKALVPVYRPLGSPLDMLTREPWVPSGMLTPVWPAEGARAGELHLAAPAAPGWMSRFVPVAEGAEFLAVEACVSSPLAPGAMDLFLASVRGGDLDFTRQYQLSAFSPLAAGDCAGEALPRREGDGRAVLQLRLEPGSDIALSRLSVQPLAENPRWEWLRRAALGLGCLLLVPVFAPYLRRQPRPAADMGMAGVAAILFGCLVSVPLKADIYALISGGREVAAAVDAEQLLIRAFPSGGFSIFTLGHAVLFCGATFMLALTGRSAWWDMFLLGLATETLQIFVPGRGPGLYDVAVDWSGIALAACLVALFRLTQRIGLFAKQ